jgi:hypothetical protein
MSRLQISPVPASNEARATAPAIGAHTARLRLSRNTLPGSAASLPAIAPGGKPRVHGPSGQVADGSRCMRSNARPISARQPHRPHPRPTTQRRARLSPGGARQHHHIVHRTHRRPHAETNRSFALRANDFKMASIRPLAGLASNVARCEVSAAIGNIGNRIKS